MVSQALTFCPKWSILSKEGNLTVVRTVSAEPSVSFNEEEQEKYIPDTPSSIILDGLKSVLLTEIQNIQVAGAKDGWFELDCKPALAIKSFSYNLACNFVETFLNDTVIKPSVVPNIDGTIGFQWYKDNKIASIAFNEEMQFIYCFIDNTTSQQDSGCNVYNYINISRFIEIINREFKND